MFSCPRCKLPQEKTHRCKYCGLVFEEHARRSSVKAISLFLAILVVAGGVFAAYSLLSPDGGQVTQPAVSRNNDLNTPPTTTDDRLKKNARDLSGDAGLIGQMTGGLTKGSVVAMVFFSIVGIGYFTYGKKSRQLIMVVCGIALLLFSYFVDGTNNIVFIGLGLSVLPFLVVFLANRSS